MPNYDDVANLVGEAYSSGLLSGLALTNRYDAWLRRTNLVLNPAQPILNYAQSYDGAGRLQSVSDGTNSGAYSYLANSDLVSTLTLRQGGTVRMTTTRQWDKLDRLQSIGSAPSGAATVLFAYDYNAANQRTRVTLADGSYSVYQYDKLGQVISGKRFWSDGTPVAGQQFEYGFDDIGNRTTAKAGGGQSGAGLRPAAYTANTLNQYTQRTNAPYVDVLGVANPTGGVTVNGNTAYRKGEYYQYALNVPNSTPQYPTVTNTSLCGGGQTETGKVFVLPATESFTHDTDGNLLTDGRWTYTWDAENRLVQMLRDTDTPSGARQKLVFEYDHQGRRIRKEYYTYSGGWQIQSNLLFLYDGCPPPPGGYGATFGNLIAELNATNNAAIRTYVWGSDLSAGQADLSGSFQGAGGVGGVLWTTHWGASTTRHLASYDGNGNVAALSDASTGASTARYDYGPFAEPIRVTGTVAKANPIRFSTKYTDVEAGLSYYGYRYYNPSTGRWLGTDPIGEEAFFLAYATEMEWSEYSRLRERSLDPLYVSCRNSLTIN